MIKIEDFQEETLKELYRGKTFIGNDPHYRKQRMVARNINMETGIVRVELQTGEMINLDLRAVLRGFDCQEYVWC